MNKRYGKTLFNLWANKTQKKRLNDAIADDDEKAAIEVFKEIFNKGEVELR